jgi:hypothetical protein
MGRKGMKDECTKEVITRLISTGLSPWQHFTNTETFGHNNNSFDMHLIEFN